MIHAPYRGVKYLVAIVLVIGLYIWSRNHSPTPRKSAGEPAGRPTSAVSTPSPAASAAPGQTKTPSAIRAPIVRAQEVVKKVRDYHEEGRE